MFILPLIALFVQELPIEMDFERWEAQTEEQKAKEAIRILREYGSGSEGKFSRLIPIGMEENGPPDDETTEREVLLGFGGSDDDVRSARKVSVYYFAWNDGVFGLYSEHRGVVEVLPQLKGQKILRTQFTAPVAAIKSGITFQGCHTEWTDLIALTDEGPKHIASFQSGYSYAGDSIESEIEELSPGRKFILNVKGSIYDQVIFVRGENGKYKPEREYEMEQC